MKIKIGIVIITTVLLSSCTTKLLYNYLDWALEWYVDDLVTLNDDQEWTVREAIASTLAWHRKNQLPFYIKSLEEAELAAKNGITHEFLKRFYFAHEKGWMDLKYHVAPTLAGLLKLLSDRQVNELARNMQAQENDLVEKYVDKPAKQLAEERTERMIDKIDNWIGDLSDDQKRLVTTWSNSVKLLTNQWAESRQQWQSHFIKIVRESRSSPEFNSILVEHFENSRKYWTERYRALYYHNVDLTLLLIVDIGQIMSNRQKRELQGKIRGLREQLVDIYNSK